MKRLFLLSILALAAASCRGNSSSGGDGKLTIAVIPKGTSHVFWLMIHGGAEKAAQELGVTVIWRGPLREDDRASQISEIEGFITRGVSGIAKSTLIVNFPGSPRAVDQLFGVVAPVLGHAAQTLGREGGRAGGH